MNDRDLERFLERHGVTARLVYPETPTPTVSDAARALGVGPEAVLKSLVFLADGEPRLVIAAGERRVSSRLLREALGVSRRKLRMASPGEALDITGYEVGAMPPFGHRQKLPTLIDRESVRGPRLYGGGGTKSAMLELDYPTLLAVTEGRSLPLTDPEEDG